MKHEHINYLINPDTLELWIGRTLKERCVLFHRHFGNYRINPTLLRKIYQIHKIRNKKIKFVKHIDQNKELEYEKWRIELKE